MSDERIRLILEMARQGKGADDIRAMLQSPGLATALMLIAAQAHQLLRALDRHGWDGEKLR